MYKQYMSRGDICNYMQDLGEKIQQKIHSAVGKDNNTFHSLAIEKITRE